MVEHSLKRDITFCNFSKTVPFGLIATLLGEEKEEREEKEEKLRFENKENGRSGRFVLG